MKLRSTIEETRKGHKQEDTGKVARTESSIISLIKNKLIDWRVEGLASTANQNKHAALLSSS